MRETTVEILNALRYGLDWAFAEDTAAPGTWNSAVPSTGHCAVVSMLVRRLFGGEYASTTVNGMSHWFNRIQFGGECMDVDLTGDQFGRPKVQVANVGELYKDARIRLEAHINQDTIDRFERLFERVP